MTDTEQSAAFLAIVAAHRAMRGHGGRKTRRYVNAYVDLFAQAEQPVRVYRRAKAAKR